MDDKVGGQVAANFWMTILRGFAGVCTTWPPTLKSCFNINKIKDLCLEKLAAK
jgi:hypothetical protein